MMNVRVNVYNECKYNPESVKIGEAVYKNIKGFEVKEISDEDMYREGFDETDEYKEYLIITMNDGETATFRNSHVDMFRAQ